MNCPTPLPDLRAPACAPTATCPIRYADFGRLHRYERSGVTYGLVPGALLRAGRRPHLLHRGAGRGRGASATATDPRALPHLRLRGGADRAVDAAGEADRRGRAVGTGRGGAGARRCESRGGSSSRSIAGDGAFYGPKIDFHVEDALGRSWQLGTVQLDYQMPQRFDLEYVAADGAEHRPVMIHRAMLGSVERFLGILIEHTAGAFPLWLAPVQAAVLPVSEKSRRSTADRCRAALAAAGCGASSTARNEKLGYKIRQAQLAEGPLHARGGREGGGRGHGRGAPAHRRGPRGSPVERFCPGSRSGRPGRGPGLWRIRPT